MLMSGDAAIVVTPPVGVVIVPVNFFAATSASRFRHGCTSSKLVFAPLPPQPATLAQSTAIVRPRRTGGMLVGVGPADSSDRRSASPSRAVATTLAVKR